MWDMRCRMWGYIILTKNQDAVILFSIGLWIKPARNQLFYNQKQFLW
jgi:hypothetical protein